MLSDPQFWVAISFILFIAAIFNPVRKILNTTLDSQIKEIKDKIEEAENLKSQAQKTLSELKIRESAVEKEIEELTKSSNLKIIELKNLSSKKLSEQIEKRKLLAENKIEQLIREANNSIKNYIASVSIQTTKNLLFKTLSKEKKSQLINTSIEELNSILKN